MLLLLLGLIIFVGTHGFTMARGRRATVIDRFGEGGYKAAYSVLSLLGIVLISIGYGNYRSSGYIPVWTPPVWTAHLSLILVWLAFIAFVATYLPGRIKSTLKHPMLVAVKIWALSHLLANGDLGSILLFASLLGWAVAARISLKRRPVAAIQGGTAATGGMRNDLIAVGAGTLAYLAFAFWLHPVLIGVPVITPR